jgi:major vault protein
MFIHFAYNSYFQLAMLQALGLQSTLITDGSTPLNLFSTAKGLVGALPSNE